MTDGRKPDKPIRIISKTERERRRFAERVNKENRRMAEKLEKMAPMVDGNKFVKDFAQHCRLVESIKHKRYSMAATSLAPTSGSAGARPQDSWSSTFDADSYLSSRLSHSPDLTRGGADHSSSAHESADSPIRSMADFRKSVISKKRVPNGPLPSLSAGGSAGLSTPIKFEDLSGDVRFELAHEPGV